MQAIKRNLLTIVFAMLAVLGLIISACKDHNSDHSNHDAPHSHGAETPRTATAALAPAEGARVKILEPSTDQIFTGDKIPLHFEMVKGKRGQHVHAYIDGELMGMFESTKGTLTGVKPGKHTLELRVVTADHNVELDATDKVNFTVE
jgi:hypothetical protein